MDYFRICVICKCQLVWSPLHKEWYHVIMNKESATSLHKIWHLPQIVEEPPKPVGEEILIFLD